MRNTFTDPSMQKEFEERGYVIIPGFLHTNEIAILRGLYFKLQHDLGVGFHATMHSQDVDYRRNVSREIGKVFSPKMNPILDDYRQLVSNFTVKEPGENSFFDFHLDWNMVDERESRSVTVWCPLEDVNDFNGNLWVLESSNKLGNSYRAGPGLHLFFEDSGELDHSSFERLTVCAKAGDAIIYDHKLFHGSPPNLSDQPRIAINQAMAAREFSAVHYISERNDLIEMYEVDDDFFCSCIIGEKNEMGRKLDEINIESPPVDQQQVNRLIHNKITVDESISAELELNGYAVIPGFFNQKEITYISAFYETIDDKNQLDFYTTHWLCSSNRKQKIHDHLNKMIKRSVAHYFGGSKSVFSYFLVKNPGANGKVFMHQDWTLVDEQFHKAYTLWIPLVDTNEKNGCFKVIPGSHKIFKNIRGNEIEPPYNGISEELERNFSKSVEANAGDAIVFDHRLIHFSNPNFSNRSRVAVGHVLVPEYVKMLHYSKQADQDNMIDVYEAKDDFLLKYSFGDTPVECDSLQLSGSFNYSVNQISINDFIGLMDKVRIDKVQEKSC